MELICVLKMRRAHLIFFPITGDKLTIDHAILEKYIIVPNAHDQGFLCFSNRLSITVPVLAGFSHFSIQYLTSAYCHFVFLRSAHFNKTITSLREEENQSSILPGVYLT